nr:MAG TPA: ADP-ribosyltransferase [Caudoviricetes sp.]
MGGRGSSMGGSQGMGGGAAAPVLAVSAAQAAPAIQATPAVQQLQAGPPTGANGFAHLTPQQASALESAAQQQMLRDPKLAAGVTDYINPVMQSNGKGMSQNANWAAATGQPLTKQQQNMLNAVDKLAKPIGTETTLYRADHPDFLQRHCGLPANYSSMSDSQLRNLLVGKTWKSTSLESTAYDSRNNPFWPQPGGARGTGARGQGGINSGNREILIRYHTAKTARAAFIQPSQSEAVLAIGTHHKITQVRTTRTGPTRTYLSGQKVLEVVIEVW